MGGAQALALRRIPASKRAYNPDRSRVLGWYVARHEEDRFDETTEYRVAIFDAETEEELTFLVTSVHERTDEGTKEGEHLESAAFDPKDEDIIVMRFVDGSEERRRMDEDFQVLDRNPEDDGVEVSDAEKMFRDMMRADAEKLKKKPKKPKKP